MPPCASYSAWIIAISPSLSHNTPMCDNAHRKLSELCVWLLSRKRAQDSRSRSKKRSRALPSSSCHLESPRRGSETRISTSTQSSSVRMCFSAAVWSAAVAVPAASAVSLRRSAVRSAARKPLPTPGGLFRPCLARVGKDSSPNSEPHEVGALVASSRIFPRCNGGSNFPAFGASVAAPMRCTATALRPLLVRPTSVPKVCPEPTTELAKGGDCGDTGAASDDQPKMSWSPAEPITPAKPSFDCVADNSCSSHKPKRRCREFGEDEAVSNLTATLGVRMLSMWPKLRVLCISELWAETVGAPTLSERPTFCASMVPEPGSRLPDDRGPCEAAARSFGWGATAAAASSADCRWFPERRPDTRELPWLSGRRGAGK
mmetsp:Transcript_124545/g.360126  ORF Transcript_124545/g.360126 Transcript_124545/m.360126 type:complete len:374 (-) Transcript_124545:222-1343(-)